MVGMRSTRTTEGGALARGERDEDAKRHRKERESVNEIATCTIARTCDRGRRRGQASAPTRRICTQVRSADLPHVYRWGGGGLRGVLYARTSGGGLRFAIFGSELVGRAGSQTATVWPG